MNNQDYLTTAELSLGSSLLTASIQRTRTFATVAKALRFAIEEEAPVRLRGARLRFGNHVLAKPDMIALYRGSDHASEATLYVIEEMPPSCLAGTYLYVEGNRYDGRAILALYDDPN